MLSYNFFLNIYIYIYICVCVREREREREFDTRREGASFQIFFSIEKEN